MLKKSITLVIILGLAFAAHSQSSTRKRAAEPDYTIAFASFAPLNSDIFVANADGSNPRPLLPHPAQDYNASFSRDGKWIIFTSERDGSADLYRVRADGSGLERMTDSPAFDDQAALSPDGKFLTFVSSRSGQADIWVLALATKRVRNITNHAAGDFRPSWSPDGAWIAFSSDRDSNNPKGVGGFETLHSTEIYMVRPDGSGLRRVTQTESFAGGPAWSPDGKRLAFYQAELKEVFNIVAARRLRGTTQIASIDLATNEQRMLTDGPSEKWSPRWVANDRVAYVSGGPGGGIEFTAGNTGARGEFGSPNWSSDRRRMVFHRDVDNNWPPLHSWHSLDPQFRLVRAGVFPSYSPSGDRLVCNDKTAGILHNSILKMDADGTGRSVLFRDDKRNALAPTWSPRGDKIAFALGGFFQMTLGAAVANVAVMNIDGTGLKVLTGGAGNYGFPSWSPDGQRIVYRASSGGKSGLMIVDIETGEVKALKTGSEKDNFPAWSPTGDLIAFTSFRSGDYDIYTIRPDGSGLRRLTNSPGNDAHCSWSPDGKWIAFASGRGGFKDEAALHPYNPQPYGEIFVMRADGSDVRQLTDNQYEEGTPGWRAIRSP